MDSFKCKQQAHQPTHTSGHTLDLVITRSETNISCLRVGEMLSNHALVIFKADVKKPKLKQLWTTIRSWWKLSLSSLEADLKASIYCTPTCLPCKECLSTIWQNSMRQRYLICSTSTARLWRYVGPLTPWLDAECRQSRRYSRMFERRYRRMRSDTDKLAWVQQLNKMHALYEAKNHQHWRTKLADSKENMKKLWWTLSGIMGKKMAKAEDNSHTANDLANFITDKIKAVHLPTSSVPLYDITYMATHILDSFSMLTIEQVEKMIGAVQGKTCQLDPAPTWIVSFARCYRHSSHCSSMSHLQRLASRSGTNMQSSRLCLRRAICMRVSLKATDLYLICHFYRIC